MSCQILLTPGKDLWEFSKVLLPFEQFRFAIIEYFWTTLRRRLPVYDGDGDYLVGSISESDQSMRTWGGDGSTDSNCAHSGRGFWCAARLPLSACNPFSAAKLSDKSSRGGSRTLASFFGWTESHFHDIQKYLGLKTWCCQKWFEGIYLAFAQDPKSTFTKLNTL